jgi:hypothetical protein
MRRNVLLAFPSEDLYGVVDTAQRSLKIGLCIAICAVIASRWLASSPARRRAFLPSIAGCVCLLLFVWLLVTDLVKGPRSQFMIVLAYSSMLVVPVAFLAGLLRSRLARGGLAQLFRELAGTRGEELALSRRGVQKHVTAVFAKLGLAQDDDDNRRVLAVLEYLRLETVAG